MRHGRKRDRLAGVDRGVETLQFAAQDIERPEIDGDVMEDEHEDVAVRGPPEERGAQYRASLQVEGAVGFGPHAIAQLRIAPTFRVDRLQPCLSTGGHHLHGFSALRGVRGPQDGVAIHQRLEGRAQRGHVGGRVDPDGRHDVVCRAVGCQAMQEPQGRLAW